MSEIDEVRANEFDQWIGIIQTQKVIDLGVGNSILDVGCGIGMYTPMYLKRFTRVVGIDPSEEYLKIASKNKKVQYFLGYGETFRLKEKFDTITMNMLLEHVDNPVQVLVNCKKYLNPGGRIIAQVPNSESATRRLGLYMGIINSLDHISDKEKKLYGHKRVYTFNSLCFDCFKAKLRIVEIGGIVYKPLPNEMLLNICRKHGKEWTKKFINALVRFGEDHPLDCANIYIVCE